MRSSQTRANLFSGMLQVTFFISFLVNLFSNEKEDNNEFLLPLFLALFWDKLEIMLLTYLHKITNKQTQFERTGLKIFGSRVLTNLSDEEKLAHHLVAYVLAKTGSSMEQFNKWLKIRLNNKENNPSILGEIATFIMLDFINNGSRLGRAMQESMPSMVCKIVDEIVDQLTLTRDQLIIASIRKGNCAKNTHIQFDSLTDEEVNQLIKALQSVHVPPGLSIAYPVDDIDQQKNKSIQALLTRNTIKHIALACMTLQQGERDEGSQIALLPQEILNMIYRFAYPLEDKYKKDNFVKFVSNNGYALFCSKNNKIAKGQEGIKEEKVTNLESEFAIIWDYKS